MLPARQRVSGSNFTPPSPRRHERARRMKRTELLRRVLADCYCQLRPSPIHGIGVFAIRDVPKGRNPFKTLPKYSTTGFVRATEDELAALPPRLAALTRSLFVPTANTNYVPTDWLTTTNLDTYLNT